MLTLTMAPFIIQILNLDVTKLVNFYFMAYTFEILLKISYCSPPISQRLSVTLSSIRFLILHLGF